MSTGSDKMPSATDLRLLIVKNTRAITKPYCIKAIKKSVIHMPYFPRAALATSAKEMAPGVANLAYKSLTKQKYVMVKLKAIENNENNHPPFKQFFGIQRNPIATKPLSKAKYVAYGPSFLTWCISLAFISCCLTSLLKLNILSDETLQLKILTYYLR